MEGFETCLIWFLYSHSRASLVEDVGAVFEILEGDSLCLSVIERRALLRFFQCNRSLLYCGI